MSFYHYSDQTVKKLISGTLNLSWNARSLICKHVSGQHPVVSRPSGGYHDLLKYSQVRASSLVCLLGVGIGVSSYLLYRFWHKFFPSTPPPPPQLPPAVGLKKIRRPNTPTSLTEDGGGATTAFGRRHQSPDSGCQTMGNTDSNPNSATVTPSSPSSSNLVSHEAVQKRLPRQRKEEVDPGLLSETEYNSFVVISQNAAKYAQPNGSPTSSESSHDTIKSANGTSQSAENRELSTHSKDEDHSRVVHVDEPSLSAAQMYSSMTSTMQGSIMSTASTDLGFVSGNYDHSRETSEEPGQYSLESFNPSFQLNLDDKSHDGQNLHKLQTMQDLTSFNEKVHSPTQPKFDCSLSEFVNHPTHMSDSSALYSFLEDSTNGNVGSPGAQSEMLMVTPPLRALSEGDAGVQSEPEMSFHTGRGGPVKHSTPQYENNDELFKNVTKAPVKKHTFPHKMKKTYSFTSEMSTTSDASYYLWGGNSIDMGENFSGRSTPDIDALKNLELPGGQTESNINEIQNQILGLRADIDEMSEKVQTLSSRDNLSYLPEIDGVNEVIRGSRMPRLSQIRRRYVSQMSTTTDTSSVQSLSFSEDGGAELKRSTSQNQGDFMWDYQSDLASGIHQNFVARRPLVGDIVEDSEVTAESPVTEQLKKYLQQQSDSIHLNNDSRNVSDLYIDDGFSFHQSYFPSRSRVQVSHVGVMASGGLSPVVENRDVGMAEKNESEADTEKKSSGNGKLCSQCKSDCCTNCGKFLNTSNHNNTSGKNGGIFESERKSNSTQTESGESQSYDSQCSGNNDSGIKCTAGTKLNDTCCSHLHHNTCISGLPTCERTPHNHHIHQCMDCSAAVSTPLRTPREAMNGKGKLPCEYVSPAKLCHAPVTPMATSSHIQVARGHPISVSTPACCHSNQSSSCLQSHCSRCYGQSKAHVSVCHHGTSPVSRHHSVCHHHQLFTSPSLNGESIDHSFIAPPPEITNNISSFDEIDSAVDSAISHASDAQFCVAAGLPPLAFSSAYNTLQNQMKTSDTATLNNNNIVNQNCHTAAMSLSSTAVKEDLRSIAMCGDNSAKEKRWEVTNIGAKHQISDYVKQEWKGTTGKAELMRKGYAQISSMLGLCELRVIRGDNYCALRSTLYQVLLHCLPVQNHLGSLQDVLEKLDLFQSEQHQYLQSWTFANRLPHDKTQVYETAKECVRTLYEQLQTCWKLESSTERERHLIDSLNSNPELDLQLLEAVKCLMMVNAVQLYNKSQNGEDVPVFVWLMFARDTSESPVQFLKNHMNAIGDSGGMEQVEMFLLGYTLGVRITVVRPSQFSKEDFITHFPSEGADGYPRVHLVAEDDRHYNALG